MAASLAIMEYGKVGVAAVILTAITGAALVGVWVFRTVSLSKTTMCEFFPDPVMRFGTKRFLKGESIYSTIHLWCLLIWVSQPGNVSGTII